MPRRLLGQLRGSGACPPAACEDGWAPCSLSALYRLVADDCAACYICGPGALRSSSDWRVPAAQGEGAKQASGADHLRPPAMGMTTADHAKVVVGAALAMLLSCAAACSPLQLQADLLQLARLTGELTPWLRYVSLRIQPVINVCV